MPRFLEAIANSEKDPQFSTSIIMVDNRDERMVSPFQAWLVSEIMANSASSINVLTERDQVMPPPARATIWHCSLTTPWMVSKAVLAISIECDTGSECAGWDADTASALAHPAFQPFTWPMLRDTSASYTDIKVYNGNELLFHWILRGYRSDTDLTVQQQFVDEYLVREVNMGKPRLSVVISAFVGWRVTVLSFECGGSDILNRAKGLSDRWRLSPIAVRAQEYVTGLRKTPWAMMQIASSSDSVTPTTGSISSALALQCRGTWLTVSHISGPTLIRTIQSVRENRARVEGPEQRLNSLPSSRRSMRTGGRVRSHRTRTRWDAMWSSWKALIMAISTCRHAQSLWSGNLWSWPRRRSPRCSTQEG